MVLRFWFLLESLSTVIGTDTPSSGTAAAAGGVTETAGQVVQNEPAGLFGGNMWVILIYAAIFVGAYFLLMRPQRKREKKMKELQSTIKTGDNVVTSGGFFGRVADIGEDCFIVEFGTNRGIRIPVQKSDVLGIRTPKTTPAPKEAIEQKDP